MIEKCRKTKSLTQKQLGKKIGVSQNTISNYENGKRIPKWNIALKLAKELNIKVEDVYPKLPQK